MIILGTARILRKAQQQYTSHASETIWHLATVRRLFNPPASTQINDLP